MKDKKVAFILEKLIPFLLLISFNFETLVIAYSDGLVVCFSLSGAWTL